MNKLIALAIKLSGGGFIWRKIDGYKTMLGFVGKMLAGVGGMLAGSSNIIAQVVACEGMDCVVGIYRGLATDPNAIMAMAGFYALCSGFKDLGAWHKGEKAKLGQSADDELKKVK